MTRKKRNNNMTRKKKQKVIEVEQGDMTMSNEWKVIELEQGWNVMQNGITKIINLVEGMCKQQLSSKDYMLLYTTNYNMCVQKPPKDYSQQLYDRYKEVFEEYINSKVLPAFREKHEEFLLKELVKRWNNHNFMVQELSWVFSYLDRYFIPWHSLPALSKVGLMCFQDLVYALLKVNIKDAVIALVNRERKGEQIDRALVKNVVDIFVMGKVDASYETDFEIFMLEDTAAYYKRKALSWIQEDSCPDYMLKAEECLKREKERVGYDLHASSREKLLEKVRHELLTQYETQLLEKEHSGCHALLRDDKVDDLSRMYRLFCKIPQGLELVEAIFRQHITNVGTALVKQVEDAASTKKVEKKDNIGVQEEAFMQKVIELHEKYLQHINKCFDNHFLFHKALREAFVVFCNKDIAGRTSAELLVTFCDNLLKKGGSQKLSDDAIEDTLEKVIKVLAYINDKDIFAEFYRKKLAKRLLFDKGTNDDLERSILTKLKQQHGAQFISKAEGMIIDLTLARENQSNFEEYLAENSQSNLGIDMIVTVLTINLWPNYKFSDLALPAEMVKCVQAFREFYHAKTKKRKLTWIYSLGTCNIIGKFDAKPIELIITTYQAAILLLFNAEDRLSYNDIKNQSNLTDEDIVRLLHSLSCAKYKILKKEPNTKMVGHNDTFEFNTKFTDKMRRVKIPLPPLDDKKKVMEDVDKDRRYAIDACIVRITKARKQLSLQMLILECVEQLGQMFKPDVKLIKKRVEDLIAREYLERDKEDPKIFKYVA